VFFWNIGQCPLEFYKHVVKSINARKQFFIVFKKSMRKHIFKTSNICFFIYKKGNSEYVKVLAVCNKQENIFFLFIRYIYIYMQHFVEKPGILIPDLYFHNIKITNHKLNTRENQRYYLFFLGWVQLSPCGWAEPSRPSRVTAQISDPVGHCCRLHA